MSSPNTTSTPTVGETPSDKPSTSKPSLDPVQTDNILPDLVVNRPEVPKADLQLSAAMNTLEDLEAVNTLLSLGDSLEDTLEEDDENALLMPIGGANNPEDIAPQPIRLDRDSVVNTIAELVETEELNKATGKEITNPAVVLPALIDQLEAPTEPPLVVPSPDDTDSTKKGVLVTKSYVLKKPDVKRLFKCSECNTVKQTIQKLNEHH